MPAGPVGAGPPPLRLVLLASGCRPDSTASDGYDPGLSRKLRRKWAPARLSGHLVARASQECGLSPYPVRGPRGQRAPSVGTTTRRREDPVAPPTILGAMTGSHREMGALAASQYGLVSGPSSARLASAPVSAATWSPAGRCVPAPAVYILMGVPPRWEQAVLAAVLAAGPDAVVSHATAARLWHLKHADATGAQPSTIHLTCHRQLRLGEVSGHQRCLPAVDPALPPVHPRDKPRADHHRPGRHPERHPARRMHRRLARRTDPLGPTPHD